MREHISAPIQPSERWATPEAQAYERCRQRIRAITDPALADVAVPACPGWTVRDVCAHLGSIAVCFATTDVDAVADGQGWIDEQLAARSHLTLDAALTEWDEAAPAFEARIDGEPKSWVGVVYDALAHEHDIRAAIGRPGARDDDGIDLSLGIEIRLLGWDIRSHDLPPLAVHSGAERWVAGKGEPAAALRVDDRWELFRVLGSRRSRSQVLGLDWRGDPLPYLSAFHMPLPEGDLVEPG